MLELPQKMASTKGTPVVAWYFRCFQQLRIQISTSGWIRSHSSGDRTHQRDVSCVFGCYVLIQRHNANVFHIWRFPEMEGTPSHHVLRIFHYKPFILGHCTPIYGNHHITPATFNEIQLGDLALIWPVPIDFRPGPMRKPWRCKESLPQWICGIV